MTFEEYIRPHAHERNNIIVIDPIPKPNAHFCRECFNAGLLIPVTVSADGAGWRCERGHVAPKVDLAQGGWI